MLLDRWFQILNTCIYSLKDTCGFSIGFWLFLSENLHIDDLEQIHILSGEEVDIREVKPMDD